jgi:hypothetical protein
MMKIIDIIKKILGLEVKVEGVTPYTPQETQDKPLENKQVSVLSIWDILKFNEHTQAFHLVSVIRFDEWVTMDEIRRRIFELFQIDYQNERSLYPYLKTLVDIGLIETSNIGGKRKWRKKDLLVKVEQKKEEKEEISLKQASTQQN